jgi:hypothetical protein
VTTLPRDKEAQEDAVLASLIACLGTQGLSASITERPERIGAADRRFPEVTCDALIEVACDAQLWAVDVMIVANDIALAKVSRVAGPV